MGLTMTTATVPLAPAPRLRWHLTPRAGRGQLRTLGDLDPLLAQLLYNRGLIEPAEARRFLTAEREPLGDCWALAGLPEALERLSVAIAADELVAIYGDYDVDGLTATALLCSTLRHFGARVLPFIPHRERDGYGLQDEPLARLGAAGASLIVTVDCGVTAVDEIERAGARGLDVIVTDHHLVPARLPAVAVLNPGRPDCAYPFKELAGVGVAFKLAEALIRARLPNEAAETLIDELLELVAIGTLADMVALRGENRTIVRRGLARLNRQPRPGLRALIASAGLEPGSVSAERVGYTLAPRLNAAGRMDDARIALDLLLADSEAAAGPLAEQLATLNRARQSLVSEALADARRQLAGRHGEPASVLVGNYPIGIAGLLAGRLAEQFNRPMIVLRRQGEVCSGSARSVPGLNVVAALERGRPHLERYGGHAMAAGLSLRAESIDGFERAFQQAVAEARPEPSAEPTLTIDAELQAGTAGRWSTLEVLAALEPFGTQNPEPVFLTRRLRVEGHHPHAGRVRLRLAGPDGHLAAVSFNRAQPPPLGATIDAVYHLKRNLWRGTLAAEPVLLDWRLAEAAAPA